MRPVARDGDRLAIGKLGKAHGHDLRAGIDALGDHGSGFILLHDIDIADHGLVPVPDHIHEGAVRAAPDGRRIDGKRIFQSIDDQARTDELPRPEL